MRAVIKQGVLVVVPETDEDRATFAAWRDTRQGHVFHLIAGPKGGALHDLGPLDEACREPINVVFNQAEPQWRPISNLAETAFDMRGRRYASVEGFWQGLKVPDEQRRAEIADLSGTDAVHAGRDAAPRDGFEFDGRAYQFGGPGHHALMREACRAKFDQHAGARSALLATGDRPLVHRTRRDSVTIPGALMADIWMRIRRRLRLQAEERSGPNPAP